MTGSNRKVTCIVVQDRVWIVSLINHCGSASIVPFLYVSVNDRVINSIRVIDDLAYLGLTMVEGI